MTPLFIDGVAMWAPAWPGWATARAAFRGEVGGDFEGKGAPTDPPVRRPSPELLPPAERRRAPDSVALALEVAAQAVAQSGHCAADLASVFTSAHGDLTLTDSLCSTLVHTPMGVSPTKFLNSVHNAASGYWAQATGCMQASVAVSAFRHSFAAGLLEACGALAFTTESRGLLGFALVLSPVPGARSVAALTWSLASGPSTPCALRSAAAQALAGNAMADGLPLSATLALDLRLREHGANFRTQ